MQTIDLVYFNAGGGHRASAMALRAAIRQQRRPWRVRLVNLLEVLDPQDVFRRYTGIGPEDLYNQRLARGWTLGLAQELKVLQALIRLGHASLVRPLQQHWLRTEPDLVVSLIPNFNRALHQSLAEALPGVPYVTVLTDLADHPPHFWIEPGQTQDLVCGTARAVQQAIASGCPAHRVHATSGMIIHPDFYRARKVDARAGKASLGFDPDRPVGLVSFGGQGSRSMIDINRRLGDVPLILVCGHNHKLADALRAMPSRAPRLVVGFSNDIAGLMGHADFFIGKPGPGSLSEAIQQRLPVIVTSNRWTMPQERYNTSWVLEQGVGIVHPSFATVRLAVTGLLNRLDEFRANIDRIDNRAVFEIPDLLQRILIRSTSVSRRQDHAHQRRFEIADHLVPAEIHRL